MLKWFGEMLKQENEEIQIKRVLKERIKV